MVAMMMATAGAVATMGPTRQQPQRWWHLRWRGSGAGASADRPTNPHALGVAVHCLNGFDVSTKQLRLASTDKYTRIIAERPNKAGHTHVLMNPVGPQAPGPGTGTDGKLTSWTSKSGQKFVRPQDLPQMAHLRAQLDFHQEGQKATFLSVSAMRMFELRPCG